MQTLFRIFTTSVGAVLFAVVAPVAASGADTVGKARDLAAPSRALTTDELYQIYRHRSWIWDDGAGYFRVAGRKFTAFSGNGRGGSYAEGRWFLINPGRTCFRATWFAASGHAEALTCFEHRTDGRSIWQRRLPDGEWYVFSHSPRRSGDEIRKLKYGDRVARGYARNENALSE